MPTTAKTAAPAPKLYPGQRLLDDGSVHEFNTALALDAKAREDVDANLNVDVATLTRSQISSLIFSVLRLPHRDPNGRALGARLCDERTRRGLDSGGAPVAADLTKVAA